MTAEGICKKVIGVFSGAIDIVVLVVVVFVLGYAGYALWDSQQIYLEAESSQYSVYKPTEQNEGKSFVELQSINPEVFAWLTVYGTNIDYPVVQGENNMKYVTLKAEGMYSITGAIFLDSKNKNDFSDFNNILYGHHMDRKAMFGEIGTFADKEIFESRLYGNLYYDGEDYGIEFFAFVHADAYDSSVFNVRVKEEARKEYLEGLFDKAVYTRKIGLTTNDRIVLLSTCSNTSTNGRDILVGRITNTAYDNPFITEAENTRGATVEGIWNASLDRYTQGLLIFALILAILLFLLSCVIRRGRVKKG